MRTRNANDIRQKLEDEIAGGLHRPGTRLEEVALADRFGVSRTPIREALRMLSTSGLIELKPRKGAIVAAMTAQRLFELFEAMAEMESVCARLAAQRMTPREHAALMAQHAKCGEAADSGDADEYYLENAAFHALIYSGCHNSFLAEELQNLRRRLQPYRRLQLRMDGRIDQSFREHGEIVNAVIGGDADAAANAARDHVSVQGHRFADWVASLSE